MPHIRLSDYVQLIARADEVVQSIRAAVFVNSIPRAGPALQRILISPGWNRLTIHTYSAYGGGL
jgi:hypothetical protein